MEGIALLYIMHSVAAVLLDNRAREQTGYLLAICSLPGYGVADYRVDGG
jgi:hypothetical protein